MAIVEDSVPPRIMIDEAFCGRLEYAITGALTKSSDIDWRRCWCDAVLLPENKEDCSISHAPKYSYPIVSGDYVEQDGKVIYKRAPRKGGG
jgi:hypothetical protein